MDASRLLDRLAADVARLRGVAAMDLTAAVPTCPAWTVEDLVRHVANLYVNVVVRRLRMPEDVPEQDLTGEAPLTALDRCYAAMIGEFAVRDPRDKVGRTPVETVYFWIRRMAHETAIHRIDVELALAQTIAPIPQDLAVDGVDEMLTGFLAQVTRLWPEDYAEDLTDRANRWVSVSAGDVRWRVTVRPEGVDVTPVHARRGADGGATARIDGPPAALLRWLHNRGRGSGVVVDGDGELIAQMKRLLTAVMNTG